MIAMPFLVTRNILAVVPAVFHEKDPFAAGVVCVAVLAPVFCVAKRYVQIDRRTVHRHPFDDYRLAIYHMWLRIAANVDSSIKTGLANTDGNADIGRECRRGKADSSCDNCCCNQKSFHV